MMKKRTMNLLALLLAAGIFLGGSCEARQAAASSKASSAREAAAKDAPRAIQPAQARAQSPAPVSVDPEFIETLEDWQLIQTEISRIEKAEGTVEIPVSVEKLRQRARVKAARLQAWIKSHGVEGWSYDARLGRFEPPAPASKNGVEARP